MTNAKLPESWRPESLLESRAEALSKETGLPLVDAVDMLTAQTNREIDSAVGSVSAKVDVLLADNRRLLAALKGLVETFDEVRDETEGRRPPPDPGCRECTADTTPDHLNTGPCAYHAAKALLSKGARR